MMNLGSTQVPRRLMALHALPTPTNITELQEFLGMVTYLSFFIPGLCTLTAPLHELLQKDAEFSWDASYQTAFQCVKDAVVSYTTLWYFDASYPITVQVMLHKLNLELPYFKTTSLASKLTSKVAEPSKTPCLPQGQRPNGQPKWCHLLVPMWGPRLWWWVHRGTSRTFGERCKEHLKAPSAIHHHSNQTGHTTNQNNFQIIGREGHNLARNIKESIYIRVSNPTLNNNIGKFNLCHIWDRVLLTTKGLTLNNNISI